MHSHVLPAPMINPFNYTVETRKFKLSVHIRPMMVNMMHDASQEKYPIDDGKYPLCR
jgi:hypothetical protein